MVLICNHLHQRPLPAINEFLSLSNKESVTVSPVIYGYTLRKKRVIKALLVLTGLSLTPCLNLDWLNE